MAVIAQTQQDAFAGRENVHFAQSGVVKINMRPHFWRMAQDAQDQVADNVAVRHQNFAPIGAARWAKEFGEGLLGAFTLLLDLGTRNFLLIVSHVNGPAGDTFAQ